MMGVYWLLIIPLCCIPSSRCNIFSSEQLVEIECGTAESPKYVFVPCPNMTTKNTAPTKVTEDVTFKLFRNDKIISQISTDIQKLYNQSDADVHPEKDENGRVIHFRVTRKATIKQAIYKCEGTVFYPPPVISTTSGLVLFFEEGQGCPCKEKNCETDVAEQQKMDTPIWIWTVVVVLLSVYSLAVTIAAFIIWYKMKDTESQSDYINTKPRPPAKRRKKRGLQHPIPKYF